MKEESEVLECIFGILRGLLSSSVCHQIPPANLHLEYLTSSKPTRLIILSNTIVPISLLHFVISSVVPVDIDPPVLMTIARTGACWDGKTELNCT